MIDLSDWEQANPEDFRPVVQLASNNVSYKDLYNWWELKEFGTYLYLSSGIESSIKGIALYTLRAWSNRWDMISLYRHRHGWAGTSIKPNASNLTIDHFKIGAFQSAMPAFFFKLPQDVLIKSKIVMGDTLYIPTEEEFDIALNRSRRKQS